MTLNEAFDVLQALGPQRAVDKWGEDGLNCESLIHACTITLTGLKLKPSEDVKETAAIMAHILWLVAVSFEAGRIYEGGIPT